MIFITSILAIYLQKLINGQKIKDLLWFFSSYYICYCTKEIALNLDFFQQEINFLLNKRVSSVVKHEHNKKD